MLESILRKPYTLPLLLLAIFGIYLINVMPVHSWTSSGVDHFDFLFAAKENLVAHSTGFPTYMWPANLVLFLFPFVHPAWILALTLSTIPMIATIWLTYRITQILIEDKYLYLPYIAALSVSGAQVLLAQVFIVEVYSLSAMLIMLTLYLHLKKKYNWAAVALGLVTGAHGLVITMGFIFGVIHIRTYWKRSLIILPITLLLYSYIPIMMAHTERADATTLLSSNWRDYVIYFKLGSSSYWWGNMDIRDFPLRLWDTVALITGSIGLTSIGLFYFFKHEAKKYWILLAVISMTVYYWFTVSVQIVHVHLALATPILIILAVIGLKYSKIPHKFYLLGAVPFIAILPFSWDIGRVIDKNISAQRYYDYLSTLPPNQDIVLDITLVKNSVVGEFLTTGTGIWWALLMLNRDTEDKVITIFPNRYTDTRHTIRSTGQLIDTWHRDILKNEMHINAPEATFKTFEGTDWYAPIDNPENENIIYIKVPTYAYDKKCEIAVCENFRLRIEQLQWSFLADRLAQTNPNRKVIISLQTGEKDSRIEPIIYSRDILEPRQLQALEEINRTYEEYKNGTNTEASSKLVRISCRSDSCLASNN